MKNLSLTIECAAYYKTAIQVPDELNLEQAIAYAKEHLDEINVTELEYVCDSDSIDDESCNAKFF